MADGHLQFSMRTGPPYSQFYEAMKGWGDTTRLPRRADADLVFEIGWALQSRPEF